MNSPIVNLADASHTGYWWERLPNIQSLDQNDTYYHL